MLPRWRREKNVSGKEPILKWSEVCNLCHSNSFNAGRDLKLYRRPFSNTAGILGNMFKKNDLVAHSECLWYAAGEKLVQKDEGELLDAENFNGFSVSAIKDCIETHRKRRCAFCREYGACSECANKRCRGSKGWYHLPCGLRNDTVQTDIKTFCSESHAKVELQKLKQAQELKKNFLNNLPFAGTTTPIGFRKTLPLKKRKHELNKNDNMDFSQSSQGSSRNDESGDDDKLEKDFMFFRISNLTPHELESRIYLDNAETDEDPAVNEDNSDSDSNEEESEDNNGNIPDFFGDSSVVLSDLVFDSSQILATGKKLSDCLQMLSLSAAELIFFQFVRPNNVMSV